MGRPTKGTETTGKTPVMAIRLPEPIRVEIKQRVLVREAGSEAELIRRALVEYFEHHPARR